MTVAKAHALDCPECGSPMKLRESKHGLFYGCSEYPRCKGTHGAHPDGKPLGTPATKPTKDARIAAHAALDTLWKPSHGRYMERKDAYFWLQSKTGLSSDACHIGSFTIDQCAAVIAHVAEFTRGASAHAHQPTTGGNMDQQQKEVLPPVLLFPVAGSSQISAAGDDPESRTLAIQFTGNARTYRYHDVPEAIWDGFQKAESKSTYVRGSVAPLFGFTRIEADGQVSKVVAAPSSEPQAA